MKEKQGYLVIFPFGKINLYFTLYANIPEDLEN